MIRESHESAELIRIVEALSSVSASGLGTPDLALRAGVSDRRIAELADRHSEYFVAVGDRNAYTINRFGKFKAAVPAITEDIRKGEVAYQRRRRSRWLAVFVSIGVLLWFSFK